MIGFVGGIGIGLRSLPRVQCQRKNACRMQAKGRDPGHDRPQEAFREWNEMMYKELRAMGAVGGEETPSDDVDVMGIARKVLNSFQNSEGYNSQDAASFLFSNGSKQFRELFENVVKQSVHFKELNGETIAGICETNGRLSTLVQHNGFSLKSEGSDKVVAQLLNANGYLYEVVITFVVEDGMPSIDDINCALGSTNREDWVKANEHYFRPPSIHPVQDLAEHRNASAPPELTIDLFIRALKNPDHPRTGSGFNFGLQLISENFGNEFLRLLKWSGVSKLTPGSFKDLLTANFNLHHLLNVVEYGYDEAAVPYSPGKLHQTVLVADNYGKVRRYKFSLLRGTKCGFLIDDIKLVGDN